MPKPLGLGNFILEFETNWKQTLDVYSNLPVTTLEALATTLGLAWHCSKPSLETLATFSFLAS